MADCPSCGIPKGESLPPFVPCSLPETHTKLDDGGPPCGRCAGRIEPGTVHRARPRAKGCRVFRIPRTTEEEP